MANKTMHHVVIGSDTFEIVDQYAREHGVTDTTLSISGAPADAKAVGDALAEKADSDDVTALDTRVTVVEDTISDTNERLGDLTDGYTTLTADKFAQATLNSDGSLDYSKKYDASTVEAISFTYPVRITVKDGYKMRILRQNQNESFADTGFMTGSYYVAAEQNIKLEIRKDPISYRDADLNTFAQQVLFILEDKEQLIRNTAQIDYLRSGHELIDASFIRGGMAQGAVQSTVHYRVYTPNMLRYDRDITIVSQDGFRFDLHYFDENSVFTKGIGWKTSYSVPAGQNFKMVVARTTEDTSEYADVYYFSEQVYIQTPLRDYIDEVTREDSATYGAISNAMFGAGRAKLVAHMGYHVGIPENSTASYIAAGKRGYWGIESDVQQTSDGYYVMCHDSTVDRTTDGSGTISQMTLSEIRALHLIGDSSLTIPTFEEYLGICKQYGCVPMIELKGTITNTAESYTKIIDIVRDMGFTPDSILFSGSKYALPYFRQANENFIFAPIYQSGGSYNWDTEFAYCERYKKTMMNWDILLGLTSERIKQAHDAGIPVCAFITDTVEATQTAFIAGADCCATNVVTPTD